jgi:uncharacterized protein YgiM (DUF1202 family)
VEKMMKTYSELITLPTFEERFEYLKCPGKIGDDTFGYDRWVNQKFYTSQQWRNFRNRIIVRDDGCDMALGNYKIPDNEIIVIHHINPMTVDDIVNRNPMIFDENNVVCVRDSTHKAIHYGDLTSIGIIHGFDGERTQNDTTPWKISKKGENAVAARKTKPKIKGIITTGLLLNVRSEPVMDTNNVIAKLKNGTEVEVVGDANEFFYKIKFLDKNGKKVVGNVMKQFVKIEASDVKDDGGNK